jgi:hypothetical protein
VLQWFKKNVLSVSDFTWDKDGMRLDGPGGSEEEWERALRGEVELNRVKHHYGEIYAYAMSVTADTDMVGRRASSWLAAYMFARGLFKVCMRNVRRVRVQVTVRLCLGMGLGLSSRSLPYRFSTMA